MSHGFADRECPMCGSEELCSVREAENVYSMRGWGATSMLDDADRVCPVCHSVRLEDTGEWRRMQTVDSRAWDLAQASSSKDVGDYEEILQAGDGPPESPEAGRSGSDTRASARSDGERESVNGAEW